MTHRHTLPTVAALRKPSGDRHTPALQRHTLRRPAIRRPLLRPGAASQIGGPAADLDAWLSILRDAIVEVAATPLSPADHPDYTGWAYLLDLGPVSITDVACDPVRVARTPRLIKRNPVDFYHLLVARGPSWVDQGGRLTRLHPGDAVLLDATRPWTITAGSFAQHVVVNMLHADVHRELRVDRCMLGVPLPAENPTLRVLTALITELGRSAPALPLDTLAELGHMTGELLVSTLRLAEHNRGEFADPRLSPRPQLLRMRDFVRRHLADPDLSPRTLAEAFDVSRRYVYAVFAEGGLSPSQFIRDTRMAEARRLLADPRHRHRSIAAIAHSVGMGNPSAFARTFRRQHDTTPQQYRRSNTRPIGFWASEESRGEQPRGNSGTSGWRDDRTAGGSDGSVRP